MAAKNTSQETYDVIVVGSGIAGSIMVKTLTQAGKKVLLLEAGLHAGLQGKTNRVFKNYMGYNKPSYGETIKPPNSDKVEDFQIAFSAFLMNKCNICSRTVINI